MTSKFITRPTVTKNLVFNCHWGIPTTFRGLQPQLHVYRMKLEKVSSGGATSCLDPYSSTVFDVPSVLVFSAFLLSPFSSFVLRFLLSPFSSLVLRFLRCIVNDDGRRMIILANSPPNNRRIGSNSSTRKLSYDIV